MAEFGVQQTFINETPNAVTAKQGIVDESAATFVGAAGQASLAAEQFYGVSKEREFKDDYESTLRVEIGLPPEPGMEPPPKSEMEALAEDDPEFVESAQRAKQVQALGLSRVVGIRMEDKLRARIAANPWNADRYRRVAATVNSDYKAMLDYADTVLKIADEQAAKAEAAMGARIKDVKTIMEKVGLTTESVFGENIPFMELSPQQVDVLEQIAYAKNANNVAFERMKAQRAEERAEIGLELREDAAGRNRARFNHWSKKVKDAEEKDNYVENVFAQAAAGVSVQADRMLKYYNPADPASRAGLKAELANAERSFVLSLTVAPDGSPLNKFTPAEIAEYSAKFRAAFIEPFERVTALPDTEVEGALKFLQNNGQVVLRSTPGLNTVVTLGEIFGSTVANSKSFQTLLDGVINSVYASGQSISLTSGGAKVGEQLTRDLQKVSARLAGGQVADNPPAVRNILNAFGTAAIARMQDPAWLKMYEEKPDLFAALVANLTSSSIKEDTKVKVSNFIIRSPDTFVYLLSKTSRQDFLDPGVQNAIFVITDKIPEEIANARQAGAIKWHAPSMAFHPVGGKAEEVQPLVEKLNQKVALVFKLNQLRSNPVDEDILLKNYFRVEEQETEAEPAELGGK